ncbi:hypothetical protein RHGRI_011566 [Rhododendron griersonianum]|uniref:PLAC8 family protein n=1 Tax=Rhododendron griersonianum TaxID=479676 RepID=A0AAV6KMD3_9ERIC|nr:hypothetical protein RHGRI_011566 [Rhododendron griersonianum]
MANLEESSPLLSTHLPSDDDKKPTKPTSAPPPAATPTKQSPPDGSAYGWTADGLPLGHGSVVGEPMRRAQWDSSLLACLGRNDEFCSSDLEGGCEALDRSCGCCGSFVEDDVQREHYESVCDFATHVFCHPCALCQEGRELRRRLPHPGFKAQPILAMAPPRDQTMGRGKA